MQKKYITLNKLGVFLSSLRSTFAPLSHTHKLAEITDYSVDDYLSSSSTKPVQNKIINDELEDIKISYISKTGADDISGSLSPTFDSAYDLGCTDKRWNDIYSDNAIISRQIQLGEVTISYDTSNERIVFSFE